MLKTNKGKLNKTNVDEQFRQLAFLLKKPVADSTKDALNKSGVWLLSYEKHKGYRIVEVMDATHVNFPFGSTYFPARTFVSVLEFALTLFKIPKPL